MNRSERLVVTVSGAPQSATVDGSPAGVPLPGVEAASTPTPWPGARCARDADSRRRRPPAGRTQGEAGRAGPADTASLEATVVPWSAARARDRAPSAQAATRPHGPAGLQVQGQAVAAPGSNVARREPRSSRRVCTRGRSARFFWHGSARGRRAQSGRTGSNRRTTPSGGRGLGGARGPGGVGGTGRSPRAQAGGVWGGIDPPGGKHHCKPTGSRKRPGLARNRSRARRPWCRPTVPFRGRQWCRGLGRSDPTARGMRGREGTFSSSAPRRRGGAAACPAARLRIPPRRGRRRGQHATSFKGRGQGRRPRSGGRPRAAYLPAEGGTAVIKQTRGPVAAKVGLGRGKGEQAARRGEFLPGSGLPCRAAGPARRSRSPVVSVQG